MIRVGLVDDHPAILDSLGRAIAASGDLELAWAARDVPSAQGLIAGGGADVVVCDVQLGHEAGGLRLLDLFGRRHHPAFLMLSAYDYSALFRTAFERGALGYLLKSAEVDEILAAVRTVAGGGTAFDAASMRIIQAAIRRPSERELEVIELVVAGSKNDEIAAQLHLSLKTIESHLRRLFDRYNVMNRTELAVVALREGWVASPPG